MLRVVDGIRRVDQSALSPVTGTATPATAACRDGSAGMGGRRSFTLGRPSIWNGRVLRLHGRQCTGQQPVGAGKPSAGLGHQRVFSNDRFGADFSGILRWIRGLWRIGFTSHGYRVSVRSDSSSGGSQAGHLTRQHTVPPAEERFVGYTKGKLSYFPVYDRANSTVAKQ